MKNQRLNMRALIISLSFVCLISTQSQAQTPTASVGMGKGLYNLDGANSCLYCHGIGGEGGKIKTAAQLDHPKKWKVFAALGGDAAFKKDPKGFLEKMKHATIDIIQLGAIRHNMSYKADGYNKAAIKPYDAQMLGLGGAPSAAWLRKYKEKGVTPAVAADSAWLYVKSLDKDGLFKD